MTKHTLDLETITTNHTTTLLHPDLLDKLGKVIQNDHGFVISQVLEEYKTESTDEVSEAENPLIKHLITIINILCFA